MLLAVRAPVEDSADADVLEAGITEDNEGDGGEDDEGDVADVPCVGVARASKPSLNVRRGPKTMG